MGCDVNLAPGAEASPRRGGLAFPAAADTRVKWSRTMPFVPRRLAVALRDGAQEISISADDAEGLAAPGLPPLPATFAVTASLAAASAKAFRSGAWSAFVHGVVGPSGARMLGRFCHTSPE